MEAPAGTAPTLSGSKVTRQRSDTAATMSSATARREGDANEVADFVTR